MTLRNLLPVILLGIAVASAVHGQSDPADPAFSAVPFDRWLAEGDPAAFHWSVRIVGTELNSHQRLQTRLEVQIDGNELVNRRGHGQLIVMIQFQDSADHVYRTHGEIDLQNVEDSTGKLNIQYFQDAMVVPGDYRVGVVIFDTKTKEHSAVQKPLHVNPLRSDPLPGAWSDLPAVELLRAMDPPDGWFLPYVTGRLHVPLVTRRPIRIEVLMNASASGTSRGLTAGTVNSRNLANMIPALKLFSQMQGTEANLHMTLLDVPKRSVVFEQDTAGQLDWNGVRAGLTAADPNKIDVHALEHREQNAQYFVDQVRERLLPERTPRQVEADPYRVLIVLSGPLVLDSVKHISPLEPLAKSQGKVYYIRYRLPAARLPTAAPTFDPRSRYGGGRRSNPGAARQQVPDEAFDSLEPLLKPLQPRLFEVYSPDQFRKALATMLEEIARL